MVLNHTAKPKNEETGFFLKLKQEYLKSLCIEGATVYGSLRIFSKTSNLQVSKISRTVFTLP